MTVVQRASALSAFSCLGEKCEDTCCRGWSMQLDEPTLNRYRKEAPELLDAVEQASETPWIMRKDPKTGYCVKFEDGLCGIHKKYGDAFLGDACHFYPRSTRKLGDNVIMTATLSCPEIARLTLFSEVPFAYERVSIDRLPDVLKSYLLEDISAQDAFTIHQLFLQSCEDVSASAEHMLLRVASISRSLEFLDKATWAGALPMYLKLADGRLPAPESNPADPFNILHALCGLIVASRKPMSDRLRQTVSDMERSLGVTLNWQQVLIHLSEHSADVYQQLKDRWEKTGARYQPILRRYLQMQLSLALFPFSGLGHTINERITIIGVRLATIKLALMCACGIHGPELPQDVVVRVVQSLSRFVDHLGDPAFSSQIYAETGWNRESRMRGLLGA